MKLEEGLSASDLDASSCMCDEDDSSGRVWKKEATEMPGKAKAYFCKECSYVYGYSIQEWPKVASR